ncbi:DEAD/DEAH box helicase [Chitinophaga pinensis]|uniref:DEAD/DEAH box helicase domain protein n=1 Tax=Chitinophaga pinensis (strain ATCC 43595 / DSM 2588 / LMG 13176 / NBRC 15968 / NCIMB 11800 / UQM 2034) TaxID=485918 RepID=A0A979G2U5_CHIPD|nr:DEAD/DEAH box helicase [Chitinophaga pinensis]ACU59563.1 DEAD/DEAH box helicase domain protein [Chitinophaga pinensis DSM 2588]
MTAYEMLSEPIRRYVRDKKWETLRPIQEAAITRILSTDNHYILVSATASGKTEAAFLPVLSAVDFKQPGIQVLYISPLVALINDQFERAELLCKYLDIPVTRWHGESNRSDKMKRIEEAHGILLITPESIEGLFSNRPERGRVLFSNLQFIIVDEVHSFLNTDRGLHLRSLLSRIHALAKTKPARMIGLSATIGDYEAAKQFTGEPDRTKVLVDSTPKQMQAEFVYWPVSAYKGFSDAFINDLYEDTKNSKVLLFPNSRKNVEELASKLRGKAEQHQGHTAWFSHHASLTKEQRHYAEEFAKNSTRQPYCIICTSTLELGIDIGSVDLVVQVDASPSVASLIQRTGRSGRQEGAMSRLLMYATRPWSLLQSIACWELYQSGYVEPLKDRTKPFDILFHQILSIARECYGITRKALVERIMGNAVFKELSKEEITGLITHMVKESFLEDLKRELIVGYKGEAITNSRDFYAMFSSPEKIKVVHAGITIGSIDEEDAYALFPGTCILLATKSWMITDIDRLAGKITVVATNKSGKTFFSSEGMAVHPKIEEKMLELLCTDTLKAELQPDALACLHTLREQFSRVVLHNFESERPVFIHQGFITWFPFAGDRIHSTLAYLLKEVDMHPDTPGMELTLEIGFSNLLPLLKKEILLLPQRISDIMDHSPDTFYTGKWGRYLPLSLKKQYVMEEEFDIKGTAAFIERLKLVKIV